MAGMQIFQEAQRQIKAKKNENPDASPILNVFLIGASKPLTVSDFHIAHPSFAKLTLAEEKSENVTLLNYGAVARVDVKWL